MKARYIKIVVKIQVKMSASSAPQEKGLKEITDNLSRPLPESYLKFKKIKQNKIKFLPWENVVKILNKHCVGWTWEILDIKEIGDRVVIQGRLTIPAKEGNFSREATGNSETQTSNYGDCFSNAEAMAFKRAAKKFGLGIDI